MNHDQNFKNLILDYPLQALRFFAAEEAAAVDEGARVVPIRQEQLQERLGERFRELDVPLLLEWPDGRREAVLFALEEESAGRRFSIHRLAHYCLDLAALFDTARVVPVVIFLGGGGAAPAALSLGGDRHRYLHFRYLACDLSRLEAARYLDSDNLVARLNLPNMAYPPGEKLPVFAQALRGLLGLEPDPERQAKYLDFIDIYAALDDNERKEFERRYADEVEVMNAFAERFTRQGMEQGMRQGMQRGEAAVLIRLMERRFGALAPVHRERIEAADAETLLEWSERILTATRPEDVLE
ncbi:hypothetical protein KBTX_02528 [wastewater metagenome]|uniref:DUF4351 domain-containing protein n=2 Tax=unclassified sequences TaxID=12908 RepID=A0A5B8RE70_9ZZZZ|nr:MULTISPECIES: DUF4351 domain-containing protein [Arhodomonas]QEA06198.1 hypothetical protein KBTEX_02528 [uncultured organism]